MLPAFRRLNTQVKVPFSLDGCDRPNSQSALKACTLFRRLNAQAENVLTPTTRGASSCKTLQWMTAVVFRRLNTKSYLAALWSLFRRLNALAFPASTDHGAPGCKTLRVSSDLFRRLNTLRCPARDPGGRIAGPIHPHAHPWPGQCLWRVYANEHQTIIPFTEPRLERGSVFLGRKKRKPMT